MNIQVKDANGAIQTIGALPAEGQATSANSVPVVIASDQSALSVSWSGQAVAATQSGAWSVSLTGSPAVSVSGSVAVTGTFWQATQPVSLASLPALATGSNTIGAISNTSFAATQSGTWTTARSWSLASSGDSVAAVQSGSWSVSISNFPSSQAVTGTFWQTTQPVSAASLPLPSGAATDAHLTNVQSAPGTSASTAITVQGSSSGAAVPISGTVTANAGTNMSTAALALETGGNLAAIKTAVTGTLAVSGTFWQATQPVSASSLPLPSGAATSSAQASILSALGSPLQAGATVPTTETYSNIATNQISVASTATLIVAARTGRKEVTVVNHSTVAVYLGGSGVTASTGLLLAGNAGEGVTLTGGATIYGITASGSETVSFAEIY